MLSLHLWDLSTLVTFRRRFCRGQLAVRLHVLPQGSMSLPAAQFRRVTGFRHATQWVNLQRERSFTSQFQRPSTSISPTVRSMLGEFDLATNRRQLSDCSDRSVDACNLTIDVDALSPVFEA